MNRKRFKKLKKLTNKALYFISSKHTKDYFPTA